MSVYDYVNERLLKAAKEGIVPWQKPWKSFGYGNPITTAAYSGINVMLAGLHCLDNGFKNPHFISMNQANKLGYQVNKGEGKNYCMITYFDFIPKKESPEESYAIYKYFRLYNLEQTSVPLDMFKLPAPAVHINPFDFQYGYEGGPSVSYSGLDRAFYRRIDDSIHLPKAAQFFTEYGLKETLFHELAHSTLISTRLNRTKLSYAKEEMVAEIAATNMMFDCGIPLNFDNHGAYLKSWMKNIEDDKTFFVSAASMAEKATRYIYDRPLCKAVAV